LAVGRVLSKDVADEMVRLTRAKRVAFKTLNGA
jgi:hypothetical protein